METSVGQGCEETVLLEVLPSPTLDVEGKDHGLCIGSRVLGLGTTYLNLK